MQPEEYEQLGSYAMIGLPTELYPTRYIEEGQMKTEYPIIIAGDNFGCGSSREHAPQSMGASGAACQPASPRLASLLFACVRASTRSTPQPPCCRQPISDCRPRTLDLWTP